MAPNNAKLTDADVSVFERRLNDYVEAFESELESGATVDVARFLPDPSDEGYHRIGIELLRVDMQTSWERQSPIGFVDYARRFPELLSHRETAEQLAFEDYRMRMVHGQPVNLAGYAQFGIDGSHWPRATDSTVRATTDSTRTVIDRVAASSNDNERDEVLFSRFGDTFGNFKLLCELGRGAFARVFLARESHLANRTVVLKITREPTHEAQKLAKLQHTHIVPIYSIHEHEGLHGICMPDLGPCTLRDALNRIGKRPDIPTDGRVFADAIFSRQVDVLSTLFRTDRSATKDDISRSVGQRGVFSCSTYEESCVTVVLHIARALNRAHRQKIVHGDLKPANVLLSSHGDAMLLDFNLSHESGQDRRRRSFVGGTLPYASPEQLRSLISGEPIHFQSDIFSLGVILYELLGRRLPFPYRSITSDFDIQELIDGRRIQPTPLRQINGRVTLGLQAIVERMIAADVKQRYASMDDVCEDLERHLENRPLKHVRERSLRERFFKFSARHPRMVSLTSVSLVSLVLLALLATALGWQTQQRRTAEFQQAVELLERGLPILRAYVSLPNSDPDMLKKGLAFGKHRTSQLDPFKKRQDPLRYQLPRLSANENHRATTIIGQSYYLMANAALRLAANDASATTYLENASRYNQLAMSLSNEEDLTAAVKEQETALRELKQASANNAIGNLPTRLIPHVQSARVTQAIQDLAAGRYERAIANLEIERAEQPFDLSVWFLLGNAYFLNHQLSDAEGCFTTCAVMWSDIVPGYFHRGLCRLELSNFRGAEADFTRVLEIDPQFTAALINRSIARRSMGDLEQACKDLDRAIELGAPQTRVYFMRSELRRRLGDARGAQADFERGLTLPPQDEQSFIRRGYACMRQFPEQAIEDFRSAIRMNPRSYAAHRNLAFVFGELLDRPNRAIEVLNTMLTWDPNQVNELLSRAVMYARSGRPELAVADAQRALELRRDDRTLFQAACVYALCGQQQEDDTTTALQLLKEAIELNAKWIAVARHDPDLASLRSSPEFQRITKSSRIESTSASER